MRRPSLPPFLLLLLWFHAFQQILLHVAKGCAGGMHSPAMVVPRAKCKSQNLSQRTAGTASAKSSSKQSSSSSSKQRQTRQVSKEMNHAVSKQKLLSNRQEQPRPARTEAEQSTPTNNWRTASTIGEAVQLATTVSDLLDIASTLWLPTDRNLPIHYLKQSIHHDRRQRWSAQLLCKLGDLMTTTTTTVVNQTNDDDDDNEPIQTCTGSVWQDDRLARAVLAAACPFVSVNDESSTKHGSTSSPFGVIHDDDIISNYKADGANQGKSVRGALIGLATLAGKVPMSMADAPVDSPLIHPDIAQGIRILVKRAEAMADDAEAISLNEVCEVRWASRGLLMRLGPLVYHALLQDYEYHQVTTGTTLSTNELLGKLLPRMQERVKHLPFDVLPMGVTEWTNALHHRDIMDLLQRQIPFFFDTITTRHGASVTERRGTAWVAAPGIGALAYSGKLMTPTSPIPTLVQSTMRLVEAAVGLPLNFFDCALCNYYPTGDAACQFHTDPEHGTMWERSSCVVAMGDPRRFAFRPIPQMSTWQAWDGRPSNAAYENSNGKGNQQVTDHATAPAILVLFAGDIVQMWGTCNDDFHHAVYPGDSANSHNNNSMEEDEVCLGRISLVLKRAMVYRGQRRGHGLPGEGRRCRRMSSTK